MKIKGQTIDQTQRNVRDLEETIEYLHYKIDEAQARGDDLEAESAERIANTTERLLAEQREILDRFESEGARAGAEARLAYHVENDTLDLY